ncbi:hypothetical protein [Agaribacter marinus]|uniref:DUF4397 domain-containing protein n=1 Tax=Agaribacter marinus TaxID=1431249 RepID=A0AA37WLI4_9ALTE|nr:hypothetical protein [Agaribacter marinus]GLR72170.1 hypothetical protein GCM10007852_30780 [Agaribacter marinus]
MANPLPMFTLFKASLLLLSIAALSACSSGSDSDDDDATAYVKFYNASADSPPIYLTLEDEDTSDDGYETTFQAISYTSSLSRASLPPNNYKAELAWQDEDSSARSDLDLLHENNIAIEADTTHWIVMSASVESPSVLHFSVTERDETEVIEDSENDVFNLRLLNLHAEYQNIDVFISAEDETFEQAQLIETSVFESLSENSKYAQDQYKIYIANADTNDVLYESGTISFSFNAQYVVAIRENFGSGSSPFVVDQITNSGILSHPAAESVAKLSVFNGLDAHQLHADYAKKIDVTLIHQTSNGENNEIRHDIDALNFSDFSETLLVDSGDFRMNIVNDANDTSFIENQLLQLPENSHQTMFLYWSEEAVDDDGDDVIDENNDGIVDALRAKVNTVLVNNATTLGLYHKQIELLNISHSEDFSSVTAYFVKANETISTAGNQRSMLFGKSTTLNLINNTYQVFAIAEIDGVEIIIDDISITLDENSSNQYLLLVSDAQRASGHKLQFVDQF